MTPEEIVGLIGNIAGRQDIVEVQKRQIEEIKALVHKYRDALLCCDRYFDSQDKVNDCDEYLCRKSARYNTGQALMESK